MKKQIVIGIISLFFLAFLFPCFVLALEKNVASQKWVIFCFDDTDNSAKTGDASNITANLRIDGAAANDVDDTNPTELEDGYYVFDITAAESNGENIVICPASSTEDIQCIGCPMALWTVPPAHSDLSISGGAVTIQDGTGSGQLDTDSGTVLLRSATETQIDNIEADTNETQVDWHDGGRLDAILDLVYADTNELQTNQGNWATATGFSTHSAADVVNEWESQSQADPTGFHVNVYEIVDTSQTANDNGADINAILEDTGTTLDTIVDSILADTNETQANWVDGGRLDLILDAILVDTGTTLEGHCTDIEADTNATLVDTSDIQIQIGTAGNGLSTIPWNASWDAEVQSEVDDALVVQELDHLVHVADNDDPENNSIVAKMAASDGDWSGFSASTDSLEAIRDRGDAEWVTGAGGSADNATKIVNEWKSQSQADPTGFHVNVYEIVDTAQTANDNGADINAILTDTGTTLNNLVDDLESRLTATRAGYLDELSSLKAYGDGNWSTATGFSTLTTSDNIGINWADISNPTTSQNLSGTTIKTATDIETDTNATLVDTNELQTNQGNWVTATGFSTHNATAVLNQEVDNDGTSISLSGAMKLMLSVLTGKTHGGNTTTVTFRDIADTKDRVESTVNATGNRTAVTRDAS